MEYAVILYKNTHLTLASDHHDQVFTETFSHHVLSKPATNATDERIRKGRLQTRAPVSLRLNAFR